MCVCVSVCKNVRVENLGFVDFMWESYVSGINFLNVPVITPAYNFFTNRR